MRKRTRRKHYPAVPMLSFVMESVRPMADDKVNQLQALEAAALESFRMGRAVESDWQTIAGVLNLAETLAEMGVGREEVTPVIRCVEQHLQEAHAPRERTGRIGTTGPGLTAMTDLCEYHQLQRTSVDLATFDRALRLPAARMSSAHPSLKVCV